MMRSNAYSNFSPANGILRTRLRSRRLPKGWNFGKVFGRGGARPRRAGEGPGAPGPVPVPSAGQPPAPTPVAADKRLARANAPVAIGQPASLVRIGRLPQGGSPAALLLGLGGALVAGAGAAWRLARPRPETGEDGAREA